MHSSVKMLLVAATMLLSGNGLLFSQSEERKDASATVACTDLDFLVGEWDIGSAPGRVLGVTTEAGPNHCYLTQTTANHGLFCLFSYSNAAHDWQELCDFTNGRRQYFHNGTRHGDEISFLLDDAKDPTTQHRLSWTRLPDGNVREVQQASTDNGKTWPKTEADQLWRRRK